MGKSSSSSSSKKKDVLVEARNDDSVDEFEVQSTSATTRDMMMSKKTMVRSTSSARRGGGGLRRFLSRSRRAVSAPRPRQAPTQKEAAPKMHLPDRRLDGGTLDATATHLEEAFDEAAAAATQDDDSEVEQEEAIDKLTELVASSSSPLVPEKKEPMVVQLEIGTRNIPIEECKAEEEPAQDEGDDAASFFARSIASLPSLDQVLFQLALAQGEVVEGQTQTATATTPEATTRTAATTAAATTTTTTTVAKKAVSTPVDLDDYVDDDDDEEEENNDDKKEPTTTTMPDKQQEQEQEETKEESKETDNDESPLLVNDDPSSSFLGILSALSCADAGCGNSSFEYWDAADTAVTNTCKEMVVNPTNHDKSLDDKVLPWVKVKSFEEYKDDVMDLPILLKSPNQYLDVFSIDASCGGGNDQNNNNNKEIEDPIAASAANNDDTRTGGLEAVLTLPEV